MKLDRNLPENDGRGKYALLKLRVLESFSATDRTFDKLPPDIARALNILEQNGILDWGDKPETEFFVMRVKDKYAGDGLAGYAMAAILDDPEYAEEIMEMAGRAGHNSPHCKAPD